MTGSLGDKEQKTATRTKAHGGNAVQYQRKQQAKGTNAHLVWPRGGGVVRAPVQVIHAHFVRNMPVSVNLASGVAKSGLQVKWSCSPLFDVVGQVFVSRISNSGAPRPAKSKCQTFNFGWHLSFFVFGRMDLGMVCSKRKWTAAENAGTRTRTWARGRTRARAPPPPPGQKGT